MKNTLKNIEIFFRKIVFIVNYEAKIRRNILRVVDIFFVHNVSAVKSQHLFRVSVVIFPLSWHKFPLLYTFGFFFRAFRDFLLNFAMDSLVNYITKNY